MKSAMNKAEGKHSFLVHMPVSLHMELKTQAAKDNRSVVAEVNHIVDRYLREDKSP